MAEKTNVRKLWKKQRSLTLREGKGCCFFVCGRRLCKEEDVIAETDDMRLRLKRFEKLALATKRPEEQDQNSVLKLYGTGTQFQDIRGNMSIGGRCFGSVGSSESRVFISASRD